MYICIHIIYKVILLLHDTDMCFKLLKLDEKPSRPLPSTLSPHTSVQAKPPDSWPRAKK